MKPSQAMIDALTTLYLQGVMMMTVFSKRSTNDALRKRGLITDYPGCEITQAGLEIVNKELVRRRLSGKKERTSMSWSEVRKRVLARIINEKESA